MCCLKTNDLYPRFLLGLLLPVVFSCGRIETVAPLYPIDSLLSRQVVALSKSGATLRKRAVIGNISSDTSYVPADTNAWNSELGILRQLQVINKPVNRTGYRVDDGLFDRSSNLTVKEFTATSDIPVRYFRVFYHSSPEVPRRIEALYRDHNTLSKTERRVTLHFENVSGENVMTAYHVAGGQKIIFGDTAVFELSGRIVID